MNINMIKTVYGTYNTLPDESLKALRTENKEKIDQCIKDIETLHIAERSSMHDFKCFGEIVNQYGKLIEIECVLKALFTARGLEF